MDQAKLIEETFAAQGVKVKVTHVPKTVRVEDENVEGGYYEYLDSDVTITLEDGTVITGNGVIDTVEKAGKHIFGED